MGVGFATAFKGYWPLVRLFKTGAWHDCQRGVQWGVKWSLGEILFQRAIKEESYKFCSCNHFILHLILFHLLVGMVMYSS